LPGQNPAGTSSEAHATPSASAGDGRL